MCRNIKPLFNFDPPVTDEEIQAASVQFVRKVSGFAKPSDVNQASYDSAIGEIFIAVRKLMDNMVTQGKPKNREEEAEKARERSRKRFG